MIDMNSFKISSMFAYIPLILYFLIKKTNICVYTQTELIVTCTLHFTIDSQIVKKVGNVRFVIGWPGDTSFHPPHPSNSTT